MAIIKLELSEYEANTLYMALVNNCHTKWRLNTICKVATKLKHKIIKSKKF